MPKLPAATLIWFPENNAYQLHTADGPPVWIASGTEEAWFAWLTTHTSFSFQGQHGHLNVYKEPRARGAGYWYAYRTRSSQTRKRYLGHSASVTLTRLEEVAQDLQEIKQERLPPPLQVSVPPAPLYKTTNDNETLPSIVEPDYELNNPSAMTIITRLSPPRLPATLVVRERLLTALDTALSHPLTLLSASAGWGKTTLLSAWAQRHHNTIAWLSLEALDNDLTRFWIELVTALRQCWPTLGERVLIQLHTRSPLSASLTILLNELAERRTESSPILLILDDYHVIKEPTIHASLSIFLEHLPSHVHLMLASRADPDLPLPRLRARGHLFEIRDTDLRFTREEAQSFLTRRMGLALDERDIVLLEARTEGWIAGLQLAGLALQKHADPSTFIKRFNGSQRFLIDYLREEVLVSLPDVLQEFLLQTSGLPCLSASLCDAITGREDNDRLLDQVERANLFLQPLDENRQWYRYHALWAQAMQHEARRRLGTATLRSLSQKASLWYEQQHLLPEAIEAALACEDFSRTAVLIGRFLVPKSCRNEYHLLRSWLRRMPEEVLQAQPELSFLYALALMFTIDRRSSTLWARVEPLLTWAEQGFEAQEQWEQLGEVLQLRANIAFFQDDLVRMFVLVHQAQPLLTEHSILYPENLSMRGVEALLAGEVHMAWQYLLEGYKRLKNLGNQSTAFAASLLLGEVCLEKGELHRASHYSHQALAHIDEDQEISRQQLLLETGDMEPFFTSWAYHILAQLSYERNEIASAQRYLSQTQALREKPEEGVHILASGSLIQARLLHVSLEPAQALDVLLRWEMHTRFPWSLRAIRTCRARLHLIDGDLSMVELWAQEKQQADQSQAFELKEELPLMLKQEEALLLVRLHIAQKQGETALKGLAPWKEKAQAQGRRRSVLEIQILEALAHSASQEQRQAKSSLLQALRLAHLEHFQRVFLDEGLTMETLLRTVLPELREASLISFVQNLLRAFAKVPYAQSAEEAAPPRETSLPLEPLSEQEQRVLRLLVAGCSNPEIARELIISVNTVKTHVQSLYRKLDIHNRVEASEVARRLSLL